MLEDEDKLKGHLLRILGSDFELRGDVRGQHLADQRHVIIDFMARPKQHLIERRFDAGWFGIEVKHLQDFSGAARGKKAHLLWQAMTYAQSEFRVDADQIRPNFVVVYVGPVDIVDDATRLEWQTLLSLAHYGRAGWLIEYEKVGWVIAFGGGWYFSHRDGRTSLRFSRRRHVGTT